jgi:cytochrome c oxidase subunit 3
VLLLVSSFTFHRAGSRLLRRNDGDGLPALAADHRRAGASAFLAGQMKETSRLPFGLTDNLFASTFYAITGFHGLHVTLGGLMHPDRLVAKPPGRAGARASDPFALEAAELYWHFVDGIWVVLYGILYLL